MNSRPSPSSHRAEMQLDFLDAWAAKCIAARASLVRHELEIETLSAGIAMMSQGASPTAQALRLPQNRSSTKKLHACQRQLAELRDTIGGLRPAISESEAFANAQIEQFGTRTIGTARLLLSVGLGLPAPHDPLVRSYEKTMQERSDPLLTLRNLACHGGLVDEVELAAQFPGVLNRMQPLWPDNSLPYTGGRFIIRHH